LHDAHYRAYLLDHSGRASATAYGLQGRYCLQEPPIGFSWRLPVHQLLSMHGQCERQRRPLQGESYEYAAQAAHAEALSGLFRVRWLNAGIDNHPAIPANDDHHLPARRCGSNRRFDLSGKDDPRKAGCSL
jgi:hypothetical protein